MQLPTIKPSREDILKCVARFDELPGISKGLPDMGLPECQRTFYSVLGFSQPKGREEFSPFGDAVRPRIGHLQPGFGIAFVSAKPGKGVLMHNHDTNETFMVVSGQWKLAWEGDKGDDHVILSPRDFISFPVGVQRRFECVSPEAGQQEGVLLAIIGGEKPVAEFSPASTQKLVAAGLMEPAAE